MHEFHVNYVNRQALYFDVPQEEKIQWAQVDMRDSGFNGHKLIEM